METALTSRSKRCLRALSEEGPARQNLNQRRLSRAPELYFAFGPEISYLLMPVWAFLLARQVGVFSKPSQPDRTFKLVRAPYMWLLLSCAMMPFFLLYGVLTRQVFARTYVGSHRHAFTVGFISLMINGVSSRVVPIRAGMDSNAATRLL